MSKVTKRFALILAVSMVICTVLPVSRDAVYAAQMEKFSVNSSSLDDNRSERIEVFNDGIRCEAYPDTGLRNEIIYNNSEISCDLENNDSSLQPETAVTENLSNSPEDIRNYTDNITLESGTRNSVQVSLGDETSALIDNDGNLWMWGNNSKGQLGDGTRNSSHVPKKIMSNMKSVLIDAYSSTAIDKSGDLWVWGWHGRGNLIEGQDTDMLSPVKILEDIVSIDSCNCVNMHYLALDKLGGLWEWYYLTDDQGIPSAGVKNGAPHKIMDNVAKFSAGGYHGGAIDNDGNLWTWGYNRNGQLGNNTQDDSEEPIKVFENTKDLCMGPECSAAIDNDGNLWMWGCGLYGQLGTGDKEDVLVPTKIMGGVREIYLNGSSAVIDDNGSLWMWGHNGYGQLGDGTAATWDRFVPTKIIDNVKSFSFSQHRSGIVDNDGVVWNWGADYFGALGKGTKNKDSSIPVKVMDNAQTICMGAGTNSDHTAVIDKSGNLWMWGLNIYGQLGDGTTVERNKPVKISLKNKGNNNESDPEEPIPVIEGGTFIINQKFNVTTGDCLGQSYAKYEVLPKGSATVSKGLVTVKKVPIDGSKITITGFVKDGKKWKKDKAYTFVAEKPLMQKNVTFTRPYDAHINPDDSEASVVASSLINGTTVAPTIWISSKPGIASYSPESGLITAVSKGTAKLTAIYGDPESKNCAKYALTVKVDIPVKSKISGKLLTGGTLNLKLSNTKKPITWSSTVSGNAIVDQRGKVSLVNAGDAEIVATVDGIDYTWNIKIEEPKIKGNDTITLDLKKKKKAKLSLTNTKYKATDIKWFISEDSDPDVISIDDKGNVTALKAGKVDIYTETGGVKNTYHITVNEI